jgi:hypothetical protein
MATLSEIRTEIFFHIGNRQDLTSFVDEKVNIAILDVMMMVKPPEFFDTFDITTSTGVSAYDLAAEGIVAVLGVVNTDAANARRRLKRGTYQEFDEMDPDDTGEPKKYFRYGNEIILYNRVPDDNDGDNYSITVRTLERPTILSSDSATFPLGLEWEEPVIFLAASKMLVLLNQKDAATMKKQEFADSLSSIVKRYQELEDEVDKDASMRADTHQYRPSTARSKR